MTTTQIEMQYIKYYYISQLISAPQTELRMLNNKCLYYRCTDIEILSVL